MTDAAEKLLAEALKLSEGDRGDLAARLIQSLEPPPEADAERAWDTEIKRRVEEIRTGNVEMIPWSEVRRKLVEEMDAGPQD
jgi:putative addiction module component (TIGR02574 family)